MNTKKQQQRKMNHVQFGVFFSSMLLFNLHLVPFSSMSIIFNWCKWISRRNHLFCPRQNRKTNNTREEERWNEVDTVSPMRQYTFHGDHIMILIWFTYLFLAWSFSPCLCLPHSPSPPQIYIWELDCILNFKAICLSSIVQIRRESLCQSDHSIFDSTSVWTLN